VLAHGHPERHGVQRVRLAKIVRLVRGLTAAPLRFYMDEMFPVLLQEEVPMKGSWRAPCALAIVLAPLAFLAVLVGCSCDSGGPTGDSEVEDPLPEDVSGGDDGIGDDGREEIAPDTDEPEAPAGITWSRTYGGSRPDDAGSVQILADEGYIVAGETESFGSGGSDGMVLRLDERGEVLWQKAYGGVNDDSLSFILAIPTGGFIAAGSTESSGEGDLDAWVLRLDDAGDVVWSRTYGGAYFDGTSDLQPTADGGYILGVETNSFGAGLRDWMLIKLDEDGGISWQRTYGDVTSDDILFSIHPCPDRGYIVAASLTLLTSWFLKLDESGGIEWQKSREGRPSVAVPAADGGFLVSVNSTTDRGTDHTYIAGLDPDGNVLWNRVYGGPTSDWIMSILQTGDDGMLLGLGVMGGMIGQRFALFRLDSSGDLVWWHTYGLDEESNLSAVLQTDDEGYIVAARTGSFDAGEYSAWIVKLDAQGGISGDCPSDMIGEYYSVDPTGTLTLEDTALSPGTAGAVSREAVMTTVDISVNVQQQCGG
jgi:hypothetical protein